MVETQVVLHLPTERFGYSYVGCPLLGREIVLVSDCCPGTRLLSRYQTVVPVPDCYPSVRLLS